MTPLYLRNPLPLALMSLERGLASPCSQWDYLDLHIFGVHYRSIQNRSYWRDLEEPEFLTSIRSIQGVYSTSAWKQNKARPGKGGTSTKGSSCLYPVLPVYLDMKNSTFQVFSEVQKPRAPSVIAELVLLRRPQWPFSKLPRVNSIPLIPF